MARFADLAEFGPTLDAAAERLSISPTAVEKDYWVSEVLRVLSRDFAGDFVFKGGTSLSKGYRLVERFSEDIDILALPAALSAHESATLRAHGPAGLGDDGSSTPRPESRAQGALRRPIVDRGGNAKSARSCRRHRYIMICEMSCPHRTC